MISGALRALDDLLDREQVTPPREDTMTTTETRPETEVEDEGEVLDG